MSICPGLRLHLPQAIEDYLAAVREYCTNLPYLTLHDIRPPKTLDEVYVPLKARPQPRKDEDKPKADQEHIESEAFRLEPLSIAEVIRVRETPHLLILGESGAGKSTLLRQVAERAWDAPQIIGLDLPHLPILVPLRPLAESKGSLEDRLNAALTSEMSLARKLPDGFFETWPTQANAHWLILLDALDEVADAARPRLMQWLKGQLLHLHEHRVVITSRPTGYKDDFDAKTFSHYDLLPFTPEQISEFARKWFSDKADAFLRELDRVHTGDLRSMPLLVTIAAKVYDGEGALPPRRSALYQQFMDIWLKEAKQRDSKLELSERLWKVAAFVLAKLAFAMTNASDQLDESQLVKVAADYLCEVLHLSNDEAEAEGQDFVHVMARRSGVFMRRGNIYYFIHPTFREYLAATATVRECKYDLECVWQRVVSRWREDVWRETAQFALSVLSDAGGDVTNLLERFQYTMYSDQLYFVGDALSEQIRVTTAFANSVIDELLNVANEKYTLSDVSHATDILGTLYAHPHAGDGLIALMHDAHASKVVYIRAAWALGELRRIDDLLALARDERFSAWSRAAAAATVGDRGRVDDAVAILLRLARDEHLSKDLLESVAVALGQLGDVNDAIQILQIMAQVKLVDKQKVISDITRFIAMGSSADLIMLARDERVNEEVRVFITAQLGRLGRSTDLLTLARDETADTWVRLRASETLVELGRDNDLLALARDGHVDQWVRFTAIQALSKYADTRVLHEFKQIARTEQNSLIRGAARHAVKQISIRLGDKVLPHF